MRSLLRSCSSASASTNSCPLRTRVRSPESIRFLASCCVMVEPPRILGARNGFSDARAWALAISASALALRSKAFSMSFQSTPSWLTKPSSSEAITARLRWPLICAWGTHCWRRRNGPSLASCAQASERWKVVDSGLSTAMAAMRSTKKSSRASAANATRPIQRSRAFMGRGVRGVSVCGHQRAQLGQHLWAGRAYAAPDAEGFGRLLHQHAQAVARRRAMLARPAEEAFGGGAIHHVVGQAARAQHTGGHGHLGAGQAARGGVDDEIKIVLQRLR